MADGMQGEPFGLILEFAVFMRYISDYGMNISNTFVHRAISSGLKQIPGATSASVMSAQGTLISTPGFPAILGTTSTIPL